jgi:TIR domain/Interferon-induced transmembrane protein
VKLFISYARADRPRAENLAGRLKQAGNTVWLDSDLRVGQAWWDNILEQIRYCDAIVVGVSRAALKSVACQRERQYAVHLGKPVLPLTFEPMDSVPLPADIAPLQVIDYSAPNESSGFVLMGALSGLPPPPLLPDPLPAPPDMPPPPLAHLVTLLNQQQLSMNDQFAIIGQLEVALVPSADERERRVAQELLPQFAARSDLLETVARRIDVLRSQAGGTGGQGTAQQWPPQDQGSAQQWSPQGHSAGQQYPPRTQSAPQSQSASRPQSAPRPGVSARVSAHWPMAITSAVLTFLTVIFCPIGIVALSSASKTDTSLKAGDVAAARKFSSRVPVMFWSAIAIWVVLVILIIIGAASSNNDNSDSLGGVSGSVAVSQLSAR